MHSGAWRVSRVAKRRSDGGFRFGRYIRCDADAGVARRLQRNRAIVEWYAGLVQRRCARESLIGAKCGGLIRLAQLAQKPRVECTGSLLEAWCLTCGKRARLSRMGRHQSKWVSGFVLK